MLSMFLRAVSAGRCSTARRAVAWLGGALALVLPSAVLAQNPPPDFTAPPGSAQATPTPVYAPPLPIGSAQRAKDAVEVYRRTCLASVGDAAGLVDTALAAGLAPYLGGPEGDVNPSSLLGDVPGQVYALPGAGDVLLAIGDDGRCTVWAQQADGPRLKAAFVTAIETLRGRGSVVRAVRDRKIQRTGGWRQQLGYDVSDARGAFSADSVTLMTSQPGMQVLRAAPTRAVPSAASASAPESAAVR